MKVTSMALHWAKLIFSHKETNCSGMSWCDTSAVKHVITTGHAKVPGIILCSYCKQKGDSSMIARVS